MLRKFYYFCDSPKMQVDKLPTVLMVLCVTAVSAFLPNSNVGLTRSARPRQFLKLSLYELSESNYDSNLVALSRFPAIRPALTIQKMSNRVVVSEDYKLSVSCLGLGLVLTSAEFRDSFGIIGPVLTAFGFFLLYQTTNIRFVLDDEALELRRKSGALELNKDEQQEDLDKDGLKSSGENIVVGGANRWSYSSWVNYDFFPSLDFPILVYFKETQTPSEDWNKGPGTLDKRNNGQIHFFPAIVDTKQLNELFIAKGLPSERYNPKK